MANSFFKFKQFTIRQEACALKVCTDACLFGAWCASELRGEATDQQNLLDIGAGTGLLSLLIQQKNNLQIEAIEIEAGAFAQALQNVQASPWRKNIQILSGDVLKYPFTKSYDYIVSNPPFYEQGWESSSAKRNTALHSHQLTLSDLFSFIAKRLKKEGSFFLLLPYKRQREINELLAKNGLTLYKEVAVCQTEKHAPFRLLLKGGFLIQLLEKSTITITENNQYTTPFIELLKDYYLYL